ncbi:ribulose-phosphate 3-epimerase [Buchnera aphidicola]|uniref:ribulose-phosphate 3-epimerase n=1 Tax=Buchnera aphidicola TaxID=9 RepID=UPI0034649C05
MQKIFIAPSILSADFSRLGKDVNNVLKAGGDIIHFDVMDNCYVPNLTFGPLVLESLKKYKICAPIDVHLMVRSVDNLIPIFAKLGVEFISFHPETSNHIDRTLSLIQKYGCKCGLVLNPATPLNILDYVMDKLDLIVLMSVNPGFGNQKFIPSILDKIKEVRIRINKFFPNILLEVDGGINIENVTEVVRAGANILVMGSAIFHSKNYKHTITMIRNKLQNIYWKLK